jgi:methylenetetrahydrofolate--tRNA-(uracil-5-)-methyltransferase
MVFPETTMVGALINYITHADMKMFQPMKAIFGLLPKPKDGNRRSKSDRYAYYVNRAHQDLENYLSENEHLL